MNIKGSQTEKNLMKAFEGESKARNKYTYFAEMAQQENLPEIKALFESMARNESIHGKLLYKLLFDGIGTSAVNLKDAMSGEYMEWTRMYPDFAKTAREEGFEDIADTFDKIAKIERDHEFQFLKALSSLAGSAGGRKAAKEEEKKAESLTVQGYKCQFCGATYEKRPDVCGVCGAIGAFEAASFQKIV